MKQLRLTWLCLLASTFPLGASPIEATFTGVNGAADFGYYVGPYYGKLGNQVVTLYCVDFNNEVAFGQQWSANLSHIGPQLDLADTRYGNKVDALQLYQEAAWLTTQYATTPTASYGDIQATIWELLDSFAPAPATNYWLQQAQLNYQSISYQDFFLVTNTGPVTTTGQVQEFLTVIQPSSPLYPQATPALTVVATPEPGWLGAVGLGLVGFGVFSRKRHNRRPPSSQ